MAAVTYGACYAAFYGSGPPVEVPFLARLARFCDLGGEVRVLDIGCGTGRLLRPLAALGWQVLGMEPQADNLVEAQRVVAQTPGVNVAPGGFGDLDAQEAFDIVTAVGGPLWYLRTSDERADALSRIRGALGPGGLVVLEGANFEWIVEHYQEPRPSEAVVNGIRVRRTPRHDIDLLGGTWTHVDRFSTPSASEDLVMVHRLAIIPVDQLVADLHTTGFSHIQTYKSWASTAPGPPEGPRILVVGRRPG